MLSRRYQPVAADFHFIELAREFQQHEDSVFASFDIENAFETSEWPCPEYYGRAGPEQGTTGAIAADWVVLVTQRFHCCFGNGRRRAAKACVWGQCKDSFCNVANWTRRLPVLLAAADQAGNSGGRKTKDGPSPASAD